MSLERVKIITQRSVQCKHVLFWGTECTKERREEKRINRQIRHFVVIALQRVGISGSRQRPALPTIIPIHRGSLGFTKQHFRTWWYPTRAELVRAKVVGRLEHILRLLLGFLDLGLLAKGSCRVWRLIDLQS